MIENPDEEVEGDSLVVDTPYGKLYFPAFWQEELRTTVDTTDGYEVIFEAAIDGHDPLALFAVNFGGSEATGTIVHTMLDENDVPIHVRLRTFVLDTEGWSSLDKTIVMSMQEDLNYLLNKLIEE